MSGSYNGAISENGIEETLENLPHSTEGRLSEARGEESCITLLNL